MLPCKEKGQSEVSGAWYGMGAIPVAKKGRGDTCVAVEGKR